VARPAPRAERLGNLQARSPDRLGSAAVHGLAEADILDLAAPEVRAAESRGPRAPAKEVSTDPIRFPSRTQR